MLASPVPGVSTRDLMERMGHDNMRAALIYQHATRNADRRIADTLAADVARMLHAADRNVPQHEELDSPGPGNRAFR